MNIPKDFNEFAIKRTAVALKNGIAYDRSIRDMLAHAYMAGFIDCIEVNNSERNHENANQEHKAPAEPENGLGKIS